MLYGVFRAAGFAGAVPVTYSQNFLFHIRATLPPTLVLSPDFLFQLRSNRLHTIPATIRGTRGGRYVQRSGSQSSQQHGGINHHNLIQLEPVLWPGEKA